MVSVTGVHEGRRRPFLRRLDVTALRRIGPVHLAVSVLFGAAAVLISATGAYARTGITTAAPPVSKGEDGPNLLVNTVAAGLVALLLVGGYFLARYAWAAYRSKS